MRELLPYHKQAMHSHDIPILLAEARLNGAGALRGNEAREPRNITDILLHSRNFEATQEVVVYYSVLGMCAVTARPVSSTAPNQALSGHEVIIHCSKTITQVYQNAALYLLPDDEVFTNLSYLWHYYVRSSRHGQTFQSLPSWVMDWRLSRVGEEDLAPIQNLNKAMPTKWFPLSEHSTPEEASRSYIYPRVARSDPRVLKLQGRVVNYIAYVSDYTCTLEDFLNDRGGFQIGWAAD